MIPFITAFFIAVCVVPITIWIAKRLRLVDDPKRRYHPASVHKGIIPRAGGLSIYLAIAVCALIYLTPFSTKLLIGILLGGLVTVLVGLWDDYIDLSPYFRFITNIVVAGIVVGFGGGIPFITNPLGGILHLDTVRITFSLFGEHSVLLFSALAALIWITWMMNAVGWSAGVDGQLPGFVVIASIVIALLSQRFAAHDISQGIVTQLALITAGAFLGFLIWNFYPQKIMPGYSGKSLAGFMLATLSILSGAKLGTAVLVLAIPLVDALYTLIRRMASGKSPFRADRGHLHHRLLDLGWGKRRIALTYWTITALLGAAALMIDSTAKVFVVVLVAVIMGIVLLSLSLFHFFRVPA